MDYDKQRLLAGGLLMYFATELRKESDRVMNSLTVLIDTPYFNSSEMAFFTEAKEESVRLTNVAFNMMGVTVFSTENRDVTQELIDLCKRLEEFDHVRLTMEG